MKIAKTVAVFGMTLMLWLNIKEQDLSPNLKRGTFSPITNQKLKASARFHFAKSWLLY